MRWAILALCICLAVGVSGCSVRDEGSTQQPVASSGPAPVASMLATESILGSWTTTDDSLPLAAVEFASDGGLIETRREPDGSLHEQAVATWGKRGSDELLLYQRRLGFPDAWGVYKVNIDAGTLTLTWVENPVGGGPETGNSSAWLAGTNHPVVVLTR